MTRPQVIRWTIVAVILIGAIVVWRVALAPKDGASGAKVGGSDRSSSPGVPRSGGGSSPTLRVSATVITPSPFTETLSLTGSIMANERIEVRSEMGGRITRIGFKEGARVRKGQMLVQMDDAELRARLKKLERQLVLDTDKQTRYATLKNIDGVSQEELEVVNAQVDVRRAEIEELQAQQAKTVIRAAFSGRAGLRAVSIGAVISPSTLITTLADDNTLKLEYTAPERYAAGIKPGDRVSFTVRGRGVTEQQTATIYALEPGVDAASRAVRIRANIIRTKSNATTNPRTSTRGADGIGDMIPGMFADVVLTLSQVNDALMVPSQSIVQDMEGASVILVRNGKAQPTKVELGGRTPSHVRVISGVGAGDTVLTSGLLMVKKNMAVQPEVQQ